MKLAKYNKSSLNKGFTLIEITLVIALILGLIAVLFVSIQAYKNGSDRARCIMNIQSVQKAVRSYANLNELNPGGSLASTQLIATGSFLETAPVCPAAGTYTYGTQVPEVGTLYGPCSLAETRSHVPTSISGW